MTLACTVNEQDVVAVKCQFSPAGASPGAIWGGWGRSALTSYLLRRAGLGEARVQCSWALSRMLYWWLYLRDVDQVKINYWNGNENLSRAADNFSISWKQMRFNGLSLCVNWNVNPRKCLPCILHLTSQGFPVWTRSVQYRAGYHKSWWTTTQFLPSHTHLVPVWRRAVIIMQVTFNP